MYVSIITCKEYQLLYVSIIMCKEYQLMYVVTIIMCIVYHSMMEIQSHRFGQLMKRIGTDGYVLED